MTVLAPGAAAEDTGTDRVPEVETIPVDRDLSEPTDPPRDAEVLEPIVVTATKRPRGQREVAGSVGAVAGRTLDTIGARSAEDFLRLVPGVSLNKEAADRGDFPIRGIATETRFQTTQRATGIYIDDIPVSDPFIPISQPDLNPFDLERVEVLKGPQATLFGSTGLAGSIRYITRRPVPGVAEAAVVGSSLQVAEGASQPFAAGMLNVPLGDSAAVRGVAVRRREPGYIDDVRAGVRDIGGIRQDQGRVQASWAPAERLELGGSWLSQRSAQNDLPYADQRERLEHGNAVSPSPSRSRFDVGNIVVGYELSWGLLTSSTSRLVKDASLRFESSRTLGTQGSSEPVYNIVDTAAEGMTEELRLSSSIDGRWRWLLGAWFLRYGSRYDQHLPAPGAPPGPNPLGEESELAFGHFRSRGTELALFADVTRKLGTAWELAAGGRLYRTDLRSHNVSGGLLVTAAAGGTQVNDDELREDGFNPRVSLSWRPGDVGMVYALVSKGFRFGGVQLTPPTELGTAGTGIRNTFKSDTLWNYEVGARTDWFARRLTVDATLFYGKWTDLQITRVDNTGLFNFVQNIAAAHVEGAELGLQALPFAGCRLSSAAAYIEARTDERFQTSSGQVPADTRLPGTPRFQVSNRLSWELPFGDWLPGVSMTHTHVGGFPNNLFATEQLGDYDTLDGHAYVEFARWRLRPRVALGVTNIEDVRGVTGAFADPSSSARDFYFVTPRTVTLTTGLTF